MLSQTVTVGPLAAPAANNICLSQTPTAGALTLNGSLVSGGVATLDTPRRVLITTTGDETGKTFVITGTTFSGSAATESIAGVNNSTTYSVLDYKTVTSITISSNAANAITVGTNGIASSAWVRFDDWAPSNISIQVTTSGTVNYTVQATLDDPNSLSNPVAKSAVTWIASSDTAVVSATSSQQSNFLFAPKYARVLLNSQTNPGFVTGTFLQSSVGPA